MLRRDCTLMKPDGYLEYGLVDHQEDEPARHPTLFVGAYCRTTEEREWLVTQVDEIIRKSSES